MLRNALIKSIIETFPTAREDQFTVYIDNETRNVSVTLNERNSIDEEDIEDWIIDNPGLFGFDEVFSLKIDCECISDENKYIRVFP